MLSLLFLSILLKLRITLADSIQDPGLLFNHAGKENKSYVLSIPKTTNTPVSYNATYIDKAENILRIPNIKDNYEEQKSKRKLLKKSPKRTIQKIIKKSKSRRKMYLKSPMISTTQSHVKKIESLDQIHRNEELSKKATNETKFDGNQMKHQRKYNSKLVRYSMPFQKLAAHKNTNFNRRNKREVKRKYVFILEDLDDIEFLSENKDSNIVKAHIKPYWK
ncbi:uncharacterized protein LOC131845447 [Achroia grisella]|uniref:uncharacterized protein LOC131845447 n=1 Tax=Achroia grisella TaxID=688607 RepID=UPI0027D27837|nr:uncharacterized protein LOC131845447 [Achroia grisella]